MDYPELELNYEWYKKHHDELYSKHPGKYLVIDHQKLCGIFDGFWEALEFAWTNYTPGEVSVQDCKESLIAGYFPSIWLEDDEKPNGTGVYKR